MDLTNQRRLTSLSKKQIVQYVRCFFAVLILCLDIDRVCMRSRGELQITSMVIWRHWDDDTYGYGSIPINTIFLVGWTSINPSYFDVNYRGTRFWHTAILLRYGTHSLSLSICWHMYTRKYPHSVLAENVRNSHHPPSFGENFPWKKAAFPSRVCHDTRGRLPGPCAQDRRCTGSNFGGKDQGGRSQLERHPGFISGRKSGGTMKSSGTEWDIHHCGNFLVGGFKCFKH